MSPTTSVRRWNARRALTSIAHGGQVLVSETTEPLLRGRMTLRSLGEHRLRDLDRRMTLHQLVADGLPSEFPALRSVDPWTGNLPEQLTSFIGRDVLLVEVAELVRSNRLVTLGGAGGVGKTRLALEVAAGLADEFPDGVWFVELGSVGDAVISARGDRDHAGNRSRAAMIELIDTVADALSNRRALVVIDNCEHVLAGGVGGDQRDPRQDREPSASSRPPASTCGSRTRRWRRCRRSRSTGASPPMRCSCSSSGLARCGRRSGCRTRRPQRP